MTLTEFLLARIAEDEAVANQAVRWNEGCTDWADSGEPDWRHIARWDPARVLAECEAKRRLIDSLSQIRTFRDGEWRLVHQRDLQLLALPYADHPDFDPAWRL